MYSEARARHTGVQGQCLQRPRMLRPFMHDSDGLGQTGIGQSHQDSPFDQPATDCRAQKEQQEIFRQTIHGGLTAGVLAKRLREKQVYRRCKLFDGVQRDNQQVGKRAH
jgi:hypothetical protein